MSNFDYNNYNYAAKKEDYTTFNQKKEEQFNSKSAQDEIRSCYNELGEYSAPSMNNICSIWNNNFTDAGNSFYSEHMHYCDIYGDAAALYGQGIRNGSTNLETLLENIKTATKSAISGLKQLISKEEQFMNKNSIEADNQYAQNNKENTENNQKEDDDKNIIDSFITNIKNIFA